MGLRGFVLISIQVDLETLELFVTVKQEVDGIRGEAFAFDGILKVPVIEDQFLEPSKAESGDFFDMGSTNGQGANPTLVFEQTGDHLVRQGGNDRVKCLVTPEVGLEHG